MNRNMKGVKMKTQVLLSLAAALILTAFTLGNPTVKGLLFPSSILTADGCIPPQFHSDYPRGNEIFITPSPKPTVIPTGWKSTSRIPEDLQRNHSIARLVRPRSGYDEIWISVSDDPYDYRSVNFLIYRTDTHQWIQAPPPPSDGVLFLDANNGVWVTSPYEPGPQLYRLDDQSNLFVPVADNANVLTQRAIRGEVKVAPNGYFWFLFSNNRQNRSLFSFDPVALESKLHLTGEFSDDIAIDKNDNIYLLHVKYEPFVSMDHYSPYVLTKYNPSTGDTESVEIPRTNEEPGGYINLYIDREDRLWVSDLVWIDLANAEIDEQHSIQRSEVFIYYARYLTRYLWDRPTVMLQSIDGRLWYRAEQGNAWFKSDSGEWCLFTNVGSNIVEDSTNNLWMIVDNDLYHLKATP